MLTKKQPPYVIVNVAMTADGKTDTVFRQGATISSIEDRERVDCLRAEVDAIMVGGRTLLEDDPRLTVKSEKLRQERLRQGKSANPIKVGIVTRAYLKPHSRFLTEGPAQVMFFTTSQTDKEQVEILRALGAQVYVMGKKQVDLTLAMQTLVELGVQRVLVEGGGILIESLLRLKLVDEINIYMAPFIFGGANAPTFVDGSGLTEDGAMDLKLVDISHLGADGILLRYLPEYGK